MISLEHFEENRRLRLKERPFAVGAKSKGGGSIFAFSGVFVLMGLFILANAAGWIGTLHSQDDVLWPWACFGAVFVAIGVGAAVFGIQGRQEKKRRQELLAKEKQPSPMLDRAWHREHFEVRRWSPLWTPFLTALFFTLFVLPFNYFALQERGEWPLLVVIGVFDCAALFLWGVAAKQVLHSFRFGDSRVIFPSFPCSLDFGSVTLRWQPPVGLGLVGKASYTLRCLEQCHEVSKDRSGEESRTLITEQLWSGTWSHALPQNYRLVPEVELVFPLHSELPATHLRREQTSFWELEVHLKCDGPDFKALYLIPIY